ncbi:MAG: DUF4959 domain-containing protein [Dysgonamonadaceae bacterium]|nr:DUF4959 domain-containing protein [Dysgonamonadaceae bacterium]
MKNIITKLNTDSFATARNDGAGSRVLTFIWGLPAFIWGIGALAFLLASCGTDNMNTPLGSTETPKQVIVTSVENISGASIIYYDRPNDQNLKYVKAVWTTDDNIEYNQTASFYTDSLLVDGFGAEGEYTVKIYSVSAGETYSEPVIVKVNPLRPPYLVAYDRMQILPNFLGIRVLSENETNAKLTFRTFKQDSVGDFVEVGTDYAISKNIEYYNRGHEAEVMQTFRVQVRDRWGHWSPAKEASLEPWYEMELPKNIFNEVALCNLSGDGSSVPDQTDQVLPSNFWGHKMHSWSGSDVQFRYLYNGTKLGSSAQCYHTKPAAPLPAHFTLDLGAQYNLSRFVLWPRNDAANLFRGGHPQIVRIYGSSYNGPDPTQLVDDIYDPDAWLDLGIFYISRADGSFDPYPGTGDRTAEDNALIENGHEFILNATNQKIRYIRVQTIKCFAASTTTSAVMISEISVFGSDK